MKLDDKLKAKIDAYFDNITPEELVYMHEKYTMTVRVNELRAFGDDGHTYSFFCIDERNGCLKGKCEKQCKHCSPYSL